jgi:hypothetical protein
MNRLYSACLAILVALAGILPMGCGGDETLLGQPSGGGGTGGSTQEAGTLPSDSGSQQVLGRSCASNADCGGLTCVKPTDNLSSGFGPPNGICSLRCNSQTACVPYGGLCVPFDTGGWCLEVCTPGSSVPASKKCHGRADEACTMVGTTSYVCAPSCGSDADCATRKCDTATGFCADAISAAPPIGTPCDAKAAVDPCAPGYCQPLSAPDAGPAVGFCTAPCRLGGLAGCGYTRNPIGASTGVVAACAGVYQGMDGVGDQGFCWQLCDVKSDCLDQKAACDQSTRSTVNHGICDPTVTNVSDGGAGLPDGGTLLGRQCIDDAECGALKCLKPTDDIKPGSGPPNGICSRPCTDDLACAPYGGLCFSYAKGSQAWCLEQCAQGALQPTAQKCHGRVDEACTARDATSYVCKPACTGNIDCAPRKCDFSTGLCALTVSAARPIGTPCNPSAATDECAPGFCQTVPASGGRPEMAFCSASCRLGGLGCGYTSQPVSSVTGSVAACAGSFSSRSTDGDQGYCRQLCDQKSDCADTRLGCDLSAVAEYGHGLCEWPNGGDGGVDAGRDAATRDADAGAE